ncbi:heterokaryon incompatibility protein-domain-containing protein [Tricladium varicosporioides]|nr:heterokaryon incompatibility protein-domain-containing protein [Hymenoscyphus varicosporioides]
MGGAYGLSRDYPIFDASEAETIIRCVIKIDISSHLVQGKLPEAIQTMALQVNLHYGPSAIGLAWIESWEAPLFDIQLVKSWIKKCEVEHGSTCCAVPSTPIPGFRIIDTERRCVVEPHRPVTFAALSYVWGSPSTENSLQLDRENLDQLQKEAALDNKNIPRVIADAIRLCNDLGERYLWVDRLCIVQDDQASKHAQIKAMSEIYSSATFTIVAAAIDTHSRLAGTKGSPRRNLPLNRDRFYNRETRIITSRLADNINRSLWNTRGWTFQERLLSRRLLFITDYQVYFVCSQDVFEEELGQFPIYQSLAINFDNINQPISKISSIFEYLDCVRAYTSRKLSYSSDILNAFTGVSRQLETQLKTSIIYGSPERYFTAGLLWVHISIARRGQDTMNIPSWSWAAWTGAVIFRDSSHKLGLLCDSYGNLVRFFIQHPENGLQAVVEKEKWASEYWHEECTTREDFERLSALPPGSSSYMPSAAMSTIVWKGCPHNPWESLLRNDLDNAACHAALKYPGSLVFNTTVASLLLRNAHSYKEECLSSERDIESKNDLTLLDIYNERSEKVGQMIKMDRTWVEEEIDLKVQHDFIVICATMLKKSERRKLYEHDERKFEMATGLWHLWVMLIRRDKADSCVTSRLGIGTIMTEHWKLCNPRWETVVLK